MTWFFAVLVVLAMGGVALVASGRGGSLAEEYDDRPDVRVPADGPLTGDDIRGVRFSLGVRGYRMSEVDALLARLAAQLDDSSADRPDGPPVDRLDGPSVDRPDGSPADPPEGSSAKRPDGPAGPAARGDRDLT